MLKLKRFSEPVWVNFPGVEGVRFQIRPPRLADVLDLKSKIRKTVPSPIPVIVDGEEVGSRYELLEDVDIAVYNFEVFKFCVVNFEGIDWTDHPDDQNEKLKTLYSDDRVRTFIQKQILALDKAQNKMMEEERKNS